MSSRALARAGLQPVPHIDLPVGLRPQYVNADGVEVNAEDLEASVGPVTVADKDAEDDEEGHDEEAAVPEAEEEEAQEDHETLLSLAESLVLPFSLAQTRQRHLTHLLPHIFSHPPIPSHSKPRARPPPKGTFLFPTPPPPAVPLPLTEYHAPDRPSAVPSTPAPAVEGQTPVDSTSAPSANPKGKGKSKERDDAPAHEIECIARCTLSIGPISYPGTELWVGRFVEPRHELLKTIRKREKGEKKDPAEKRAKAEKKERKRPSLPAPPSNAGTPGPSALRYGARPPIARPPMAGVAPRQPGGPMPRPPGAAPARPPIEPSLIQRVNQAATQHPWLSVIIHKAARNSATKEELAKLGRIVGRLGKGEGIGEGPLDGLPTPPTASSAVRPAPLVTASQPPKPPTSSASSPLSSPAPEPTASPTPLNARPAIDDDDSELSSEEEVNMKGPKQVGGGPIDPELQPQVAKAASAPLSSDTTTGASPLQSPAPSAQPVAPPSSIPSALPMSAATQLPSTATPARPSTPSASSTPASTSALATLSALSGPPSQPAPISSRPPPPPHRIYPLPPPFLLVAFKEMPTEKYLLPLGSCSYISRVGEPSRNPGETSGHLPTPAPNGPPVNGANSHDSTKAHEALPAHDLNGAGRGRTRAALGRGAKDPKEVREEIAPIAEPPPETPAVPISEEPLRPDLPILPGMSPPNGTVLLSTIIPSRGWKRPDWEKLEKRMPFYNKDYDEKPILPEGLAVKAAEPDPPSPKATKAKKREPTSPVSSRQTRHHVVNAVPALDPKRLLNLSTENFIPAEGHVQAVTIRLEGIDDSAWSKVRQVIEHVEGVEIKALGASQSDLLEFVPPPPPSPIAQIPQPFDPALHPRLLDSYSRFRKSHFEALLQRVPQRTFPKFRLPAPRGDIKDALTDKWGPRPYPMSTRPLYLTSPPPDGVEPEYEQIEEPQPKRKRGQAEEEVMFEMPVSLEMLDERVELGAKKSVTRRVGKLKLNQKPPTGKRHGKRYIAGTTCEGCARNDVRVWRRGPGGNGTLCNACGDKYTAGTLGELKAPGAASSARNGNAGPPEGEPDGDGTAEGTSDQTKETVKQEMEDPARPADPVPSAEVGELPQPNGASSEAAVPAPEGVQQEDVEMDDGSARPVSPSVQPNPTEPASDVDMSAAPGATIDEGKGHNEE